MIDTYLEPFLIFGAGLFVSLVCTPMVIHLAQNFGFLSPIDFRRKQKHRIPLLGGLGIFLAVAVGTFMVGDSDVTKVFLCSLPVFLVGVFDDRLQLSSHSKGFIHIFAVFLWLYWMPESSLWMLKLGMPKVVVMGFMAFWIVGLINAMNMIDGMDTEAGGISLIASTALFAIFSGSSSLVLLSLIGGLLGFLYFNKFPARIYLGDSGSNFLGFYMGALSLSLPVETVSWSLILVPLFIFAVPEIDAVLSMWRRFKSSSSIFGADHDHIHHKLQKIGLSKPQSALVIHGVAVFAAVTAYLNFKITDTEILILFNTLAISSMMFVLGTLFFIEYAQAKRVSQASRTLLDNHLKLEQDLILDEPHFAAVVYDLLPYYKEMQLRGVGELSEFVASFAHYIKKYHKDSKLIQFGSYTIISVHTSKYSSEVPKNELVAAYYQFIKDFSVVKSESKIPWGMTFYSSRSKGGVFLEKFGLSIKSDSVVKLRKVA